MHVLAIIVEVGVEVTVVGAEKDGYPGDFSLVLTLRAISTVSGKNCGENKIISSRMRFVRPKQKTTNPLC
ncbi:hypothetical protein GIB67_029193, partial [Kingdonia uniflora]